MPFDPERHGGLIECQILTPEAFHECLLQEDAADDLCYVHGWNVPPEDALSEAADFATGVRFAGVPLVAIWSQKVDDPGPAARLGRQALEPFASWLVRGRGRPVIAALLKTANRFNLTPASYRRASDAIIGADPPLIELIGQLERIGKRHNLVAHSMGNRVALLALKVKSLTTASTTFVAPDVSSDEFRDLVQRLPAAAGLKSVYFSKNDIALMISESENHARRAGQGGPEIETMDFAEAIDVSDVKADPSGHSYHRFSGSVAEDIGDIVVGRLSAGRRFPRIRPVRAFWTISDLI
jgi:esterase/lipase superfamily enzyme